MTTATLSRKDAAPVASTPSILLDPAVLNKAMKFAASIVAAAQTVPILANVRLVSRSHHLELTTCDLDVEFRQCVPLVEQALVPFATTVDARRLSAIVAAAPAGSQMSLAIEGGRMVVKAGRSRWVLPILPVTDFPTIPMEIKNEAAQFEPASKLSTCIDRVIWSVCSDVARPWMAGICINPEAGKVRFTACEGNTMASLDTDVAFPAGAPQVTVPTKFCSTLSRLCDEAAGVVSLAWDEKKIRAEVGDIVLTGKVIDYPFPEYRRIIPADCPRLTIEPEAARAALRRVQLVVDNKTRIIEIAAESDRAELRMQSPDTGEGREEIPADVPAQFNLRLNATYLSSMLAAIGGETIEIHQPEPLTPSMFRRVVPDGFIGIIGAMR